MNRTHRGEPKEFSCVNSLRELGIPEERSKFSMLNYLIEEAPDPWIRERGQRDALSVGLFNFLRILLSVLTATRLRTQQS